MYHALLSATLSSWPTPKPLSVDSLIVFIRSVVDHLPSSSAGSEKSPNVVALGEILVDILWSVDSELEEIVGDAKNAANAAEQGALTPATVAQAVKAKDHAESDKGKIVMIVRTLLVCSIFTVLPQLLNSHHPQTIGILDADICRERLDLGLVASVGLVIDKVAFERKEIRTRTGLLWVSLVWFDFTSGSHVTGTATSRTSSICYVNNPKGTAS